MAHEFCALYGNRNHRIYFSVSKNVFPPYDIDGVVSPLSLDHKAKIVDIIIYECLIYFYGT